MRTLALYHVHLRNFSAGKGHNPVEKGAYRSGLDIEDPLTGKIKAYAWKTEKDQIETEMILPEGISSDSKFRDPKYFFQEIRNKEKAKNARYFKELEVSLVRELSPEDRKELGRKFSKEISDKYNVPVNLSFHDPKGQNNPHFHLSIPLRSIDDEHFTGNKIRELDKQKFLLNARQRWAEISNQKFKERGMDIRIDHRSYKESGIEKTPQLHVNPKSKLNPEWEKAKQEYNILIKADNLKIEIQNNRKERKKEIKNSLIIKRIERENKRDQLQREEVKEMASGPSTGRTKTVYDLFESETDKIKKGYKEKSKQYKEQREKNKEHKKAFRKNRNSHRERMGRSKGVIALKKGDITELKFGYKELKTERKSLSALNPRNWQARRDLKKQMRMNKIKQKRKKVEIRQERGKQRVYKEKFKEQKLGYRKEKRKELKLFMGKSKDMMKIKKMNLEKKKTKNRQIPENVVSLKEYKQKFKLEKTREQSKERTM